MILALLLAASTIYTVGPIPASKVKQQNVSAAVALAALTPPDSNFTVHVVDNGDINGDGNVTLSDAMRLFYHILMPGRPKPLGKLVSEFVVTKGKGDSVTVQYIFVDSVGVTYGK